MSSEHLANTWLTYEMQVNRKGWNDLLSDLNAGLDASYTKGDLEHWSCASRQSGDMLPADVRAYMVKSVLRYVLGQEALALPEVSKDELDLLVSRIA